MKLLHAIFVSLFLVFASLSIQAASVDINTADAKTIAKATKGIGFKKAQAIVAYRDKHDGPEIRARTVRVSIPAGTQRGRLLPALGAGVHRSRG